MTVRKGYGTALLFWWFTGAFGGHRIYIQERMHYIFWYFFASCCTLGILPIVDVFFIRRLIDQKFEEDRQAAKRRELEEDRAIYKEVKEKIESGEKPWS